MQRINVVLALAVTGAIAAGSAGAYATDARHLARGFMEAALIGPPAENSMPSGQRDVIQPPSSVDPGMALDPPDTGAKMPILRPQPIPNKPIAPR